MKGQESMNQLLTLLDEYRMYPRFQLERHFDVILMKYVPPIVNAYFKRRHQSRNYSVVFLEFPLQRKLVKDNFKSESESVSIDYIVFDLEHCKMCFVELKTDSASNNNEQNAYLEKASKLSFVELLGFIEKRMSRGDDKAIKYRFLHRQMESKGVIPTNGKAVNVKDYANDGVVKIVPRKQKNEKLNCIKFSEILNYGIKAKGFPLVAKYLELWQESPESRIMSVLRKPL